MFKLLIVDSIMALFRVDFTGSKEMSERQSKLGLLMSKLQVKTDKDVWFAGFHLVFCDGVRKSVKNIT